MSLRFNNQIDKNQWKAILLKEEHIPFFQTLEWGDIEERNCAHVDRFEIFDKEEMVGVMQIFEKNARRGHFLHVRHGPVITKWTKNYSHDIALFLKDLAKKRGAWFVRISPLISEGSQGISYLKSNNFHPSPVYNIDAENRWVLPLASSEEEVLLAMRKTTRYMTRRGEKENIEILSGENSELFNKFQKIYIQTAQSKGFVPHKLVKEEFEYFRSVGRVRIYIAMQNKKILAGALIVYSGNSAIYRHGATSSIGRQTAASYVLQWQAIKDAKREGLAFYDFWGISKDDNPKNPWYGLSSFKKGFGGYQVDYVHSLDMPISWKYGITYLADFLTTIQKGHFLR
jgi:lipid II:glycine glycyltransferase (peptidoglycan interpeptide bridge formation enzyme)